MVSLISLIIITRRTREILARVSFSSRQFPPLSHPGKLRTGSASDANEGGWSLQPTPAPIPFLVFLFSSSPQLPRFSHCRLARELEVRGRSDDREFPRRIVTKLLTASRPTRARRRQCRGFSQVSRYRHRGPRQRALSVRACQLPKNKINYGTPVFMPRRRRYERGEEGSSAERKGG